MSGATGVYIQKPDLHFADDWAGPIIGPATYQIQRLLNAAGTFTLTVPVTVNQAPDIETGWRVSLAQEGFDLTLAPGVGPSGGPANGWIFAHGKVTKHSLIVGPEGQALLQIEGVTPLGITNDFSTHLGLQMAETALLASAAALLPELSSREAIVYQLKDGGWIDTALGAAVSELTLNDMTCLQALLKLAELWRCNLRENWGDFNDNQDIFEFVAIDDVPDPSGPHTDTPGDPVYFRVAEFAGPEQAAAAAQRIALIAELPLLSYDGSNLANRIIGVGTNWDGTELQLTPPLSGATLYTPQVGTNPDSTSYDYIEDTASITRYGLHELRLVRSDIKNPNNPALDGGASQTAAREALLAVCAGELMKRRSEVMGLTVAISNGEDIWALPGDKVRLQYAGHAILPDGSLTWIDLDQWMLVTGRVDTGDPAGVRQVSFDLASPTMSYAYPRLPAVIIPPPKDNPPHQDTNAEKKPAPPGSKVPPAKKTVKNQPGAQQAANQMQNLTTNNGAYQPCCPDPTTDTNKGPQDDTGPFGDGSGGSLDPPGSQYWVSQRAGAITTVDPDTEVYLVVAAGAADPTLTGSDVNIFDWGHGHVGLWSGAADQFIRAWYVRVTGPAPSLTLTADNSLYQGIATARLTIDSLTPSFNYAADSRNHPGVGTYNLFADGSITPPADNSVLFYGFNSLTALNTTGPLVIHWDGSTFAVDGGHGPTIGPGTGQHDIAQSFQQTVAGALNFALYAFTGALAVA